jgi:alpha-L-rhamnosidase
MISMKLKLLFLSAILCISFGRERAYAQAENTEINPYLLSHYWDAEWISHPAADLKAYGVYHLRKTFELNDIPQKFIIHVSADNRYRLFVNGTPVCFGPARGDLNHWNFETLDISRFLKPGSNIIGATVWNFGDLMPVAQFSRKTAFLLQGNTDSESVVNTGKTWKIYRDEAYSPLPPDHAKLQTYIVVGPGDKVEGDKYPWGWENSGFDDSGWQTPIIIGPGRAKGLGTGADWDLVPRSIPFMEEAVQRFSAVRKAEGCKPGLPFLGGKEELTVPAHSKAVMLLDQGFETTAYPEIQVSGGAGSDVELIYAEALFDVNGEKGNRNETEGKTIKGLSDRFIVGSATEENFRPLWFRTFRYVQVTINTGDSPITFKNIQSVFTAYPFTENATFRCSDPEINEIFETGWHTLRLCSNETHFDCPYYEQLQYVGDTRIQCLIALYVSGDDRLMRNAISLFDRSRFYEGLTCSRYPSNDMQVIPPFSLFWTNMISDYNMLRGDTAFVKTFLTGIEGVLNWYGNRIDSKTGMLGPLPYWNFVDWPSEWPWDNSIGSGGVPKGGAEGGSSILSYQFAYSLNKAADLFESLGYKDKAAHFRKQAARISKAVTELCWDSRRKLIGDTPDKTEFSQHANIMAVLADAVLPVSHADLIGRVAGDNSLIQATVYYRFYLLQAMKKAGLANSYTEMLGPWRDMIHSGLTTFAEKPEPTRSDCHAWSASPTYDLLATVCGVQPGSAGFASVIVEPHPGKLEWIEASMPHPKGTVRVKYSKSDKGGYTGEIILPAGLSGIFRHNGKETVLIEGMNRIAF